jgi:hypothetical protein
MSDIERSVELTFSDEELTEQALAADPNASVDPDAVPMHSLLVEFPELLPAWYMPAPGGFTRTRGKRVMATVFIGALVVVNMCGLCVTYGHLEIPF